MGRFFPLIYDIAMKPLEKRSFTHIRENLIQKANGKVLEIGSGTGINLPYYRNVDRVDAVEPNPFMIKQFNRRRNSASVPIYTHVQSAENLNFQDHTFDTVVSTLVFCTIPDPIKALQEIRRVAKPHSTVLFFEHIKMKQPLLAKMQDALNPMWKKICDGCHLNRDTLKMIQDSGLIVNRVTYYYKGLFIVVECENKGMEQ